jgi:3-methyladenine DNA glycosylase AlkC
MELMKNGLGPSAIKRIAHALSKTDTFHHSFDSVAFIQQATASLETLELKQRVQHVIETLHDFLPREFDQTVNCLLELPDVWDSGDPDDPLRSFAAWPIIDYLGVYGVDHPTLALPALRQLTPLFSAEFAIRPFLLKHPELCHQYFEHWVEDDCEHVRRLVSEGARPRLPWGIQLKPYVLDPTDNLRWLEALKDDASLYVRRSVANHLNDISKDHPQTVIELCQAWYDDANDDVKWLIKHALRSLIKSGQPEVFPLLGYSKSVEIETPALRLNDDKIILGDALEFELSLTSANNKSQKLVVDFALHLMKANGNTAPKVFKWKSITLNARQTLTIKKRHAIKAITTRRYYSGPQKLEILINGTAVAETNFDLKLEA